MSVLAAIVFLFVGFVLGVAVPRPRSREADALRDSLGEACQSLSEWIAKWNQAKQVAQVERERKTLVEGQRSRLARLLRQYDRCECGLERREHQPGGIALASWRCDGFRLKTPADPLETTVAVDPPRSASELAEEHDEDLPMPPSREQIALMEHVAKHGLKSMPRIVFAGLSGRDDSREWKSAENRDEPPAECCSEGDAGESFAASVLRGLEGDNGPAECEFALPSHVTVEHPDGSSEVMPFEEANAKHQVVEVPR